MALALQEYRDALRYASRYGTGVALRDALEMRRLVAGGGAMRFVLDTCERRGWRCTFFVTARNLWRHRWLDEALAAGHEVGSHSFSHRLLPSLDDNALRMEFSAAASAFSERGIAPEGFRPPFLAADVRLPALAREFGFRYLSGVEGGEAFRYPNGLDERTVASPYDWHGLLCQRRSPGEIAALWEASPSPVLLVHPRYARRMLPLLPLPAGDYRACAGRRSLSFDVY